MARFQVTGVNDKRDFCECCGRNGLQRVVWILDTETGDEKHFGTSCATKPAKGFDCADEIKAAVKSATERTKMAWRRAWNRYKAEGGAVVNYRDPKFGPCARAADEARYIEIRDEEVSRALAA